MTPRVSTGGNGKGAGRAPAAKGAPKGAREASAASAADKRARRIDAALKKAFDKTAYLAGDDKAEVRICAGTACHASGRVALRVALDKEFAARGLGDKVAVVETGCHGFCEEGPIVVVRPEGLFYPRLKAKDIAEIVETSIVGDGIVDRLLYKHPQTGEALAHERDIPFYSLQERIVLSLNGKIDPYSIDDYLAHGGYAALARVLAADDPEAVIDEVERSGLRGRGGAGFPTGTKWKYCRANPGDVHYVICNADEGDPGAFMDRSVLEGDPHSVLEGMCIAAHAIGASKGYVYVSGEYPLAIKRIKVALRTMRRIGILGDNVLGSGLAFDIQLKEGAGAYVCGEETALMASIEGHRGLPQPRPPFPAVRGLREKPTNINNVETFACVSSILREGASRFASCGTMGSKGSKTFSITGKVKNAGLIEVPMGITLRQVVEEIGGGIAGRGRFKAAQTGGPSGGCIPAKLGDIPMDYESLAEAGSMLGSGGLVIMDETNCMVDLARYFLTFTQSESCGKCTPCRLGTKRMLSILERICAGQGRSGDIEVLEELGRVVKCTSLCGLGQTAPNPVLSTIRYFREEYEEHIRERHCRAAVCREMVAAR